jgi:hypothetical protein
MREDSIGSSYRRNRVARFVEMLDLTKPTRILDLGGTASYWKSLGVLYDTPNVHITVVNFTDREYDDQNISIRRGDACALSEYPDNSFRHRSL